MQNLARILQLIDRASDWSGKILSWLILVMIGIILFEVVARYGFDDPTKWAHESSSMVFGIFGIGAGAYALLYGAHVKMDIFYRRWSKRTKAIVDMCTFFFISKFLRCLTLAGDNCWMAIRKNIGALANALGSSCLSLENVYTSGSCTDSLSGNS